MRALPLAVAAIFFAAPALDTQETSPPVFGVQVEMVNLSVAATDGSGKYVDDLPCTGFSIRENGDAQHLELCEKQELPIDLVLLVDASTSMGQLGAIAKESAVKFVRTLRPQDRAALIVFGKGSRTAQDFTSDTALLETAIGEISFKDSFTQLYQEIYTTVRKLERERRGEQRHRVLIVFTDGEDVGSLLTDEQAIAEASRGTTIIYSVLVVSIPTRNWEMENKAKYFVGQLARTTGGRAFVVDNAGALRNAYDLIAQELRMQYRLGYYPTHTKEPGPQRHISVVVAREGVTLRYRQSYWVQKGRTAR